MKEFDEKVVISCLRGAVPRENAALYDDDELLNVVDIIWDWYEDNGFLDIDGEEDADPSMEELVKHVEKMIAKDSGSPIKKEDVAALVAAELAYESSLEE